MAVEQAPPGRPQVEDPVDLEQVHTDVGVQSDGPFYQDVGRRKRQGRDVKILLTAKDGQTGVGKSNLSDFLAHVLDTTDEGFTPQKTTIDPGEFIDLYQTLGEGSALVMEEGEQFDARRSNQHENVDASHKWMMARVREICSIVNLPSPQEIDSRFERLADYWINVLRRGKAQVYKKRVHPIKCSVYYKTCQMIEWPNMDGSQTFRAMQQAKDDRLSAEDSDDNYVRESEVEERIEKAKKEVRMDVRDQFLTAVYKDSELTAKEIARLPVVDVSAGRVRQIANGGT
jgi:hypothetical protein